MIEPLPHGVLRGFRAKLEPSKERGVSCPVLRVAPFSLPTKGPSAGLKPPPPPPPANPNPGVGQEAEGLDAGMCLHGPEMAQITVSSSWSRPTSPRAVCLGFCVPPGSAAQPREVLGLAYRLSWPGSCPCSYSCVSWLCCLQGMSRLAGSSSLTLIPPL